MTRLEGTQLMLGLQPLYGKVEFSPDENTSTTGGDGGNALGWFPGGQFFITTRPTDDLSLGFGSFSYFGLGLDYRSGWVGRYYVDEVALLGMTFMPSAAYRVNDWLSVGAGLNAMYGYLKEEVAISPILDQEDGWMEVEDGTWGFGGNFGVLVEPVEGTRFGLTYLSKVHLDFEDSPSFRRLELSSSRLNLDMEVPQMVMFSVFHDLNDQWAIMGNLGWQDWSQFGKVGIGIDLADEPITVDRNYKDTWHAGIGAQYRASEPWLLSAGFSYDSSVVDDEDRTPDLPLGESYRLGLGAQYDWSEAFTLGFGYELVWLGDLDMDRERGRAGRISGEYEDAALHFFNVSGTWRF
jgi:long-chain fatty acid transport protein